jgi:predicted enzyme related to lactoylglutathione lyase
MCEVFHASQTFQVALVPLTRIRRQAIIVTPDRDPALLEEVTVPICDGAPLGAPCWIDLTSSELDRAQDFYGTVFGWTFGSAGPALGGYVTAAKNGHSVAGMVANVRQWPFPDGWSTYFHTADIDATVCALTAAGASLHFGPVQLPAKGVMSAATDPSGAAFRLWQPLDALGFEVVGEAGAPVWHQLTTRDYRVAIDFYREVFGWRTEQVSDTDQFRYATALFGDQQLLGVMDGAKILPQDEPSRWTTFFGAEDVDKTLQVITDKGGDVLRPAEDTPYGRLAAAADPTGVMFNLSSFQD